MDDSARGNLTLLPLLTPEATEVHLVTISGEISQESPWILQQFIPGAEEFCTHALVMHGTVRAFVACRSSELLMHYEALSPGLSLWDEMLQFTQEVAKAEGKDFTGHLSFHFMQPKVENGGLYAIECNPRAHTAVVLFRDTPGLVDAYLDLLQQPETSKEMRRWTTLPAPYHTNQSPKIPLARPQPCRESHPSHPFPYSSPVRQFVLLIKSP